MACGAEAAGQGDIGERTSAVADKLLRAEHAPLHDVLMRRHFHRLAEHAREVIFAERRFLGQVGQRQRLVKVLFNPRQKRAQNVRRQAAGNRWQAPLDVRIVLDKVG